MSRRLDHESRNRQRRTNYYADRRDADRDAALSGLTAILADPRMTKRLRAQILFTIDRIHDGIQPRSDLVLRMLTRLENEARKERPPRQPLKGRPKEEARKQRGKRPRRRRRPEAQL